MAEDIRAIAGTLYFGFKDLDQNKPAASIILRVETVDYFSKSRPLGDVGNIDSRHYTPHPEQATTTLFHAAVRAKIKVHRTHKGEHIEGHQA